MPLARVCANDFKSEDGNFQFVNTPVRHVTGVWSPAHQEAMYVGGREPDVACFSSTVNDVDFSRDDGVVHYWLPSVMPVDANRFWMSYASLGMMSTAGALFVYSHDFKNGPDYNIMFGCARARVHGLNTDTRTNIVMPGEIQFEPRPAYVVLVEPTKLDYAQTFDYCKAEGIRMFVVSFSVEDFRRDRSRFLADSGEQSYDVRHYLTKVVERRYVAVVDDSTRDDVPGILGFELPGESVVSEPAEDVSDCGESSGVVVGVVQYAAEPVVVDGAVTTLAPVRPVRDVVKPVEKWRRLILEEETDGIKVGCRSQALPHDYLARLEACLRLWNHTDLYGALLPECKGDIFSFGCCYLQLIRPEFRVTVWEKLQKKLGLIPRYLTPEWIYDFVRCVDYRWYETHVVYSLNDGYVHIYPFRLEIDNENYRVTTPAKVTALLRSYEVDPQVVHGLLYTLPYSVDVNLYASLRGEVLTLQFEAVGRLVTIVISDHESLASFETALNELDRGFQAVGYRQHETALAKVRRAIRVMLTRTEDGGMTYEHAPQSFSTNMAKLLNMAVNNHALDVDARTAWAQLADQTCYPEY